MFKMPTYQEFKYDRRTGKTVAQPRIANPECTLDEAKLSWKTLLTQTAENHLLKENTTATQTRNALSEGEIRMIRLGNSPVTQREISNKSFHDTVMSRVQQRLRQIDAATDNFEVEAVSLDFSDITLGGV